MTGLKVKRYCTLIETQHTHTQKVMATTAPVVKPLVMYTCFLQNITTCSERAAVRLASYPGVVSSGEWEGPWYEATVRLASYPGAVASGEWEGPGYEATVRLASYPGAVSSGEWEGPGYKATVRQATAHCFGQAENATG